MTSKCTSPISNENNSNGFHNNQQAATSFFLHMNRYRPEESCFYTSPHSPPNVTKLSQVLTESSFPLNMFAQVNAAKNSQAKAPKKTMFSQSVHRNITRRTVENNGRQWVCEYCHRVFDHNWNLKTHLQLHTGEKPYSCQICKHRFHQKFHLVKHVAGHHPFPTDDQNQYQSIALESVPPVGFSRNKNFSCGFCGSSFENGKVYLERHIFDDHKDKLVKEFGQVQ